jgi:hypothetical protein
MNRALVLTLALTACGVNISPRQKSIPAAPLSAVHIEESQHGIVEHFFENEREQDVHEIYAFGHILERQVIDYYADRVTVGYFERGRLLYEDVTLHDDTTRTWYDRDGRVLYSQIFFQEHK